MLMVNHLNGFGSYSEVDERTKLLLHFDGTNGSTAIVDSSIYNRTATVGGNAQISTAQSMFGGSSGLWDGTGDYVQFANSPDFDFGNAPFTIDFCIRPANISGTQTIITKRAGATNNAPFHIIITGGVVSFYASSNGTSLDIANGVSMGVPSANVWSRHAIVRDGSNWATYKDGAQISTFTSSATLVTNTAVVEIGAQQSGGSGFNGYMDEIRLSNVARWTGNFTPPAGPYF